MNALIKLRNLILGYDLTTNPEKGLNFLEFLFYFILIAISISCCVYIIKDIIPLIKKKLRQAREEAESKEGEVSIHIKPKKSEPKNNNTGEYVDFENIDDK